MTRCHGTGPRRFRHDNTAGEWLIALFAGIALLVHLLLWSSHVGLLP